jgi:hypothetical protein
LRLETLQVPRDFIGLDVIKKSMKEDGVINDKNDLLNINEENSITPNAIDREDFNNFDNIHIQPENFDNILITQTDQENPPDILDIDMGLDDITPDVDINQIDKEFKNINNLEAIDQEIASQKDKQSLRSRSDINENLDKELHINLGVAPDADIPKKEKIIQYIEKNKCLENILPDLKDKSDIPVIEEMIKNSEVSFIKTVSQEEEILMEKIEEDIEKKSNQEIRENIELKETSVKNLEFDNEENIPQQEQSVHSKHSNNGDHEDHNEEHNEHEDHDITIPITISPHGERSNIYTNEELCNSNVHQTPTQKSVLDLNIGNLIHSKLKESGITNIHNIGESPSFSVEASPNKKATPKPKLSDKFTGNKRHRPQESESKVSNSNLSKSALSETPVKRKRHINNILPESEDEDSVVSVKNIRTRSGYKNKEISSVNSMQESDEDKSVTHTHKTDLTPSGKKIKMPKSKENSAIKQKSDLSATHIHPQPSKIKVFFIDRDLLDKQIEKSIKNSNCELADFEEADVFLCNKLSLNLKLLIAVNMHKPILSVKWLEDSIKSKQIKKYDDYYVKDKEFERKYNFKLSKLMTDKPYAQYLQDYSFYVTDQVYGKDDIVEIIQEAEGRVIDRLNKLKREDVKSIIIADKDQNREDIKNWKIKGYQVYNSNLILDGVYTQTIDLNKIKYKL